MQHNGPNPNGSTSIELRRRLYAALPGDTVQLAGEERPRAFETVFLCSETIEGQVTEWRWIFLDDGSLLEAAPKGIFRYGRHQAIDRGTRRHQELVAQDGALVRFEGHVRAGTWAQRPVHVAVEGVSYRVVYTGTVSAQRLGPEPPLAAWRTFNPDPAKNVFFGLTSTSDEQATILGLWTDDVSLSFGRELRPDELTVTPGAGGA